jgi:hypothetical protein
VVTDQQVRALMKEIQREKTLSAAAAKSAMDEKTARKYRKLQRLPSQCKPERYWKTRPDVFEDVWPGIEQLLQNNPAVPATTVFDYLSREHPGRTEKVQHRQSPGAWPPMVPPGIEALEYSRGTNNALSGGCKASGAPLSLLAVRNDSNARAGTAGTGVLPAPVGSVERSIPNKIHRQSDQAPQVKGHPMRILLYVPRNRVTKNYMPVL